MRLKNTFHFMIYTAVIVVLIGYIIPFISNVVMPSHTKMIKDRNLDTGALIYSESEEAIEGNYFLLKSK